MQDQLRQSQRALERLLPHIESLLDSVDQNHQTVFLERLHTHFPDIARLLHALYGNYFDFFYHLGKILTTMTEMYVARSPVLKALDREREADPLWFQSEKMVGAVLYVDLFGGTLAGVREKIPYLLDMGITYLHLMPLFQSPDDNSDGGYAISNYRQVNPGLGTMDELAELAAELRQHGISLVLDFVFNHTSDEHDWAMQAKAGDEHFQEYYYFFEDRQLPDAYEQHLREIFPQQDTGNFTFDPELQKWVWTTFYHFQWDLNYSNPEVFNAMLSEMLFLANEGVEVLRLDAVAFIWKQLGTSCENLPQAHTIIQAYNAIVKVVAPAMLFKSEAIVHPREVASYISPEECPVSYNPTLMALLWEALATRDVTLLRHSMSKRFDIAPATAWVNYIRVHDDIGWSFADEDAADVGINGFDHRLFLNQFYTGQFVGSFAKGLPFNYNLLNQDMRISGTCASLAGLERALESGDDTYIDHALKRIVMLHSIILSVGGIPLIYLGDEIATLNDYSYRDNPEKQEDSRWVHRPSFDWDRAEKRHEICTSEYRVYQNLAKLIQIRKQTPALGKGSTLFFDTGNEPILGYIRNRSILVLANFSDFHQVVRSDVIQAYFSLSESAQIMELVSNEHLEVGEAIMLQPYTFMWLQV